MGKSRRKEDKEGTGPGLRGLLARCPNPPLASSFPASPRTKQKTRIRARVADPAPSFSPSICPYGSVLPHTSGPLSILPLHFTYSQREAQSEAQSLFRLSLLHFPFYLSQPGRSKLWPTCLPLPPVSRPSCSIPLNPACLHHVS